MTRTIREVIGPPECPIMHRWTLWPWGENLHENKAIRWKLMVHHFLPNADDRAVHDHPRPFLTVVLRGSYDDMKQCDLCGGDGWYQFLHEDLRCGRCQGSGVLLNERMRPGMLRFRPAEHKHRTKVAPEGCWTLVLMGSLQRQWGFWRGDQWWPWREFEKKFGFGMRCSDE